jgi:hypothetical protein
MSNAGRRLIPLVLVVAALTVGVSVWSPATHRAATGSRAGQLTSAPKTVNKRIRIYISFYTGTIYSGYVVIAGGIGDAGKVRMTDASGNPSPFGGYYKFVMAHGTFIGKLGDTKVHQSAPTKQCTIEGTFTGPLVLSHGTGAYADISGTVKGTQALATVAPRYVRGPNKGGCNFTRKVSPLNTFNNEVARGTVTFPA